MTGPDDLGRIADELAIRRLSAQYSRCFDNVDPDAYADVFTDDGVLEVVGNVTVSGRDGLRKMCEGTGFGVVHFTTDAIIDIDGDTATQDCYLIVSSRKKDRSAFAFTNTGRYQDQLVRTPDGWKFKRRVVTLDLAP